MSFDISWIASADISITQLEQRLGLSRTGRTSPKLDFDYASVSLTDGWSLVIANRVDYLETLDLASLSAEGHIVTLALHDGIMVSVAESWINRQRDWRVLLDGQKHIEHLDVSGGLPEHFAAAKSKCEGAIRSQVPAPSGANVPTMPPSERAIFERMGLKVTPVGVAPQKVDFHFEVPIDLTHSIVGFRQDQPPRGLNYYELRRNGDPSK